MKHEGNVKEEGFWRHGGPPHIAMVYILLGGRSIASYALAGRPRAQIAIDF